MKRTLLIYCLLPAFLFINLELGAQQTEYYNSPGLNYRQAVELFEQQSYAPAREVFDRLIMENALSMDHEKENAEYYSTVCAVELGDKDALQKVEEFSSNYPESKWLPALSFDLGKIYFGKRQYSQALESFNKVSQKNLSKAQRSELNYMKGVCYLKKSDFSKALSSFDRVDSRSREYASSAKYYKSHINYQQGEYDKAASGFKSLENDRRFRKYVPEYLINIAYEQGNYQQVIDEGSLYMSKADRKSQADIARLIANSYYELNDYEKAYEYFQIFENQARRKIEPGENYRIGYTKLYKSKFADAINNFQQATAESGILAQNAWYHLGYCYLNTGEHRFALNAFLKAYNAEGGDEAVKTDALLNFVKISMEQGADPYNDPMVILEDFIEKNPNNSRINEAYDLMAQLYLSSKNYNAALKSIEKTRSPNSSMQKVYQQLAYSQGVDYYSRGSYIDAIGYFKKSLKYTPDKKIKALAKYWIADSYYRQNQYNAARDYYNEFLKESGAKSSGYYEKALYSVAYTYFNKKEYASAIRQFTNYLNSNDDNGGMRTDAMLRLADSYFISRKYENALSWYNKVLKESDRDLDYALYQKAFCYGARGDFNNKIASLNELVKRHGNSMLYDDALYEIASTYSIMNDNRHAISNYEKLVREKPQSSFSKKSLVKMGFLYYNNNQYEKAISSLKQVISKYPASLEAKEALNTLENVYMDMGRIEDYFTYARSLDFVQVSTSVEDSLTFTTGENFYVDGDCNNSIKYLTNYTEKFPKGGFILKAYNMLTNCYERNNDSLQAIKYYEKIISFPENQYSENAYLTLARLNFNIKDFSKSLDYYEQVLKITEDKNIRLEAIDGVMRAAYLTDKPQTAIDQAKALLKTEKVGQDQTVKAHYIIGKSYLLLNKMNDALREFEITDKLSNDELGAESKYLVALIKYKANLLDESESIVYELSEQYPSYGYWVAKGFILLADIYYARDNIFQAQQTLQSVIDNYQGNDLREEAQGKLNRMTPLPEDPATEDDN
ncbi:MAG: hypothetical protein C0595_09245 [Marinilabiliales bacterium]|nr:MAG: hypothetical protein C0595_09245 [Marinilabiliales bacterium]